MNNLVVFSNHLLPYSQTFILSQGEKLNQYQAHYLGSDCVSGGLTMPYERTTVFDTGLYGKLYDKALKLGFSLPNKAVKMFFDSINPSLCHAHFGPNGMTATTLLKRRSIPLIITFHGFDLIEKPDIKKHGRLHVRYYKKRAKLAHSGNLFIAVSDRIKKRLILAGFPENKIVRHYIGIDTTKFCPDESVGRESFILCVARMTAYKGHKYLLSAMKLVQAKYPELELVLVGDGEELESLKAMALRENIKVRFVGRQTPEEVLNWMRRARVYVQPSVRLDNGQEEALALTIVEAQAVGTPAIVFKSGGMPEAVDNGKTGIVVEERDVEQLASSINLLSRDDEKWLEYHKNARDFVLKCHDLDTQCYQLEKIYNDVVDKFKEETK